MHMHVLDLVGSALQPGAVHQDHAAADRRADDASSDGGPAGLYSQLVGLAERAQVEATLAEHFLAAAVPLHGSAARGAGSTSTQAANGKGRGP